MIWVYYFICHLMFYLEVCSENSTKVMDVITYQCFGTNWCIIGPFDVSCLIYWRLTGLNTIQMWHVYWAALTPWYKTVLGLYCLLHSQLPSLHTSLPPSRHLFFLCCQYDGNNVFWQNLIKLNILSMNIMKIGFCCISWQFWSIHSTRNKFPLKVLLEIIQVPHRLLSHIRIYKWGITLVTWASFWSWLRPLKLFSLRGILFIQKIPKKVVCGKIKKKGLRKSWAFCFVHSPMPHQTSKFMCLAFDVMNLKPTTQFLKGVINK